MILTPRQAVQRILLAAEDHRRNPRLAPLLTEETAPLKSADARLAREIVMGVTRNRSLLDRIIEAASRKGRLPPPAALVALRAALYQLSFLERIPAHAAVDGAVRAVRSGASGLAGFVNACLRTVCSRLAAVDALVPDDTQRVHIARDASHVRLEWPSPLVPDRSADLAAYLSIRFSCPHALVKRWLERFSAAEVEQVCRAGTRSPAVQLRHNPLRTDRDALIARLQREGVNAVAMEHPAFARVVGTGVPVGVPCFEDGWFTVQDRAAIDPVELLGAQPGDTVLDLCAAPGGKTTAIAEAMGDRGEIWAHDAAKERLQRVAENATRLRLSSIRLESSADALDGRSFDRVLVDAPCSNTGVLARRVEARWRWSGGQLRGLVAVQVALLRRALAAARPGGVVVYSTCSLECEENDQVVAAVADSGVEVDEVRGRIPDPPHHDGGWAARLRVP